MNVVIIVQARMGSTRLPGKVLKKVLGKTLLEYLMERLRRAKGASDLCVATTTHAKEQPLLDVCARIPVKVFRGSEGDVLERYFGAARELKAEAVVRVTADCPLIDPQEVDKLIECYLENSDQYDYLSNGLTRTYPLGMGAEIFSFEALEKAHRGAKKDSEREHVTPYLHMNPRIFRLRDVPYKEDLKEHRWTVDTDEDFQLVSKIIEALYPVNPEFSLQDILTLLGKNPQWQEINRHVRQKAIGE